MMYETGNTISPAVRSSEPTHTCLVSNKLAAIKQTQNSTDKHIKGMLTIGLTRAFPTVERFIIILFFTRFTKHSAGTMSLSRCKCKQNLRHAAPKQGRTLPMTEKTTRHVGSPDGKWSGTMRALIWRQADTLGQSKLPARPSSDCKGWTASTGTTSHRYRKANAANKKVPPFSFALRLLCGTFATTIHRTAVQSTCTHAGMHPSESSTI